MRTKLTKENEKIKIINKKTTYNTRNREFNEEKNSTGNKDINSVQINTPMHK